MFLTTAQVAERAGVSVFSVNNAVRNGRLYPMGEICRNGFGACVFDEIDVNEWCRKSRKPWRANPHVNYKEIVFDLPIGEWAPVSSPAGVDVRVTRHRLRSTADKYRVDIRTRIRGERLTVLRLTDIDSWDTPEFRKLSEQLKKGRSKRPCQVRT